MYHNLMKIKFILLLILLITCGSESANQDSNSDNYNDEDFEKYKKTLVFDKKTGRYTVVGCVYQKEQVSDAFGSVEDGKINNMSTMDMIEDKMGDGFLKEYGILP